MFIHKSLQHILCPKFSNKRFLKVPALKSGSKVTVKVDIYACSSWLANHRRAKNIKIKVVIPLRILMEVREEILDPFALRDLVIGQDWKCCIDKMLFSMNLQHTTSTFSFYICFNCLFGYYVQGQLENHEKGISEKVGKQTSTKFVHGCVSWTKVNKGKQRWIKVNKGKQSQGLLKSIKSLRTFEFCEKVWIIWKIWKIYNHSLSCALSLSLSPIWIMGKILIVWKFW